MGVIVTEARTDGYRAGSSELSGEPRGLPKQEKRATMRRMVPDKKAELYEAEHARLAEDVARVRNWKRWGPYLSERQWGTIREDYSADGDPWSYFDFGQSSARAYRWGEDGLLGFTDRECRLCFAIALWNEKDPILKERLFGLSGPEGNHGEDVKESYFYVDSTPTHSYMRGLYKYPQGEFPYEKLREEGRTRGRNSPEYELADTGIFDESRYFDVQAEYAKASPDDILIRLTISNRGPESAPLHLMPTLWFRNTWSWGRKDEGYWSGAELRAEGPGLVVAAHPSLGTFCWHVGRDPSGELPRLLFTENVTNVAKLFGVTNPTPHVKDAFHDVILRAAEANPELRGTKACAQYRFLVEAGETVTISLRLRAQLEDDYAAPFGESFQRTFALREAEADAFYQGLLPDRLEREEQRVVRQAYAGLLWNKQFYYYVVKDWLAGDPAQPAPPETRAGGRNHAWPHLYNRDVISMPDKWEYPWYAAWDLAFHMIPFSHIDPDFAKEQLILLLREWYMHPSGQIPAYEFAFGDVNPPVHAWAAWRVYKITGRRGERDRTFLERIFMKLVLNFTWWVNRKDVAGQNLFAGGFLGLDNIGVFDRSRPLPDGGYLEQADGTAWMAFYCSTMLSIALELAREDPAYEDMASKFFEHFIAIADAMNQLGGHGLWDEEDGFYYDQLNLGDREVPLKVRSMVGIIPLFAVEVLDSDVIDRLPGFKKRMNWFLENRPDVTGSITAAQKEQSGKHRLLAIPSRERLERVLRYVLDEEEFLSPYGVRSLSKVHARHPYVWNGASEEYRVEYEPAESRTGLFGGNSNWRGPIWFPLNFLLIESLERYHHFYGEDLRVEFPTGSGMHFSLDVIAEHLAARLSALFLPEQDGSRPCHGRDPRFRENPHWRELLLFHEYFNPETGEGMGASHQTGWTALVASLLEGRARNRAQGR